MIELSEGAKVLVSGPNWLGDCVMTEPVVRLLKDSRPDLEVTLMVPDSLQGLFTDHPSLAGVFPYEKRGKHAGLGGRMQLWKDLSEESFEAVVLLRNSFGAAFDASRAGIPERIGYPSFPRTWFLTRGIELPEAPKEIHRSNLYAGLLEPLGVEGEVPLPQLSVSDELQEAARGLIQGDLGETSGLVVALHPSARYGPAKMWGVRRFAGFADRMLEDHGATVLLLGTKDEQEIVSETISFMDHADIRDGAVRNLVGRTRDILDLAAVFSCCDLVVGNDSGPVHLAGAVGVPTIAVFGSTSSDHTGVRGPKVVNIWEHFDCSPCFKRECPKEDYMACMDAVPVARVYNAARDLLGLEEEDFEDIQTAVGDAQGIKDEGI